ncbi:hypothetical protein LCGC14_1004150 [marine sediment metagenome]|uniref:Uncharacterized protein n=1 Tax=marine sediment metagenome TaxID=412755 RepID=A0A0F9R879_9ZZZZ
MTNDVNLRERTRWLPKRAFRMSVRTGSSQWRTSDVALWKTRVASYPLMQVARTVDWVVLGRVEQPRDHLLLLGVLQEQV